MVDCRQKMGGIIYQIAGNQIDLKAVHPGVYVGVLCIFLLVILGDESGDLQGRSQIIPRRHAQKDVQIMISGKPRASGGRAYQHGFEREAALFCQILYTGYNGGRALHNSLLIG